MKSLRSAGRLLLAVLTMSLFAMASPSMASEITLEAVTATFDLGMDFDLAPEANVDTTPASDTVVYITIADHKSEVVLVTIEPAEHVTSNSVAFVSITSNVMPSVIAAGPC